MKRFFFFYVYLNLICYYEKFLKFLIKLKFFFFSLNLFLKKKNFKLQKSFLS